MAYVIYETEPIGVGGALEAAGVVHWFCSEQCRSTSTEKGKFGQSSDFEPETVCEWCEHPIET